MSYLRIRGMCVENIILIFEINTSNLPKYRSTYKKKKLQIWDQKFLMEQCPSADILLATSSACEKWCSHIWSQYAESFLKYHEKAVSVTIEGTIT